jgi:hypothetical protein
VTSDVDVSLHDKPDRGGACPYCQFQLKAGGARVTCPECGARYHAECWAENSGCAVIGCTARIEPAEPVRVEAAPPTGPQPTRAQPTVVMPPAAPAVPAPPGPGTAPGRRGGNRVIVGLLIVALAVLAGAAAALLAGRGSSRATASTPTARTVERTHIVTDSVTSETNTFATTPAPPAPSSSGGTRLVTGTHYAVRIPADWVTESSGVFHPATQPSENSYTESRWHAPEDPGTYIHIDYTVGLADDTETAARGVRAAYHKGQRFQERSFSRVTFPNGGDAWRWRYTDVLASGAQGEKVDYFMSGCDTGYALLGVTEPDRWEDEVTTFSAAAASLEPRC